MHLALSSVLIQVTLSAGAPSGAVENADWSPLSAKAALASARTERKPAIVDFYATWCMPCREMERVTFPDPAVRELLRDFVRIKVDAERGEGRSLATTFEIFGYPTLLLLDASGKEIGRLVGYHGPEEFLDEVRYFFGVSGPAPPLPEPAIEPIDEPVTATAER